ncbi:RNA-dependent RNA polymerase, partial [Tremellales sp. Uapishka_1]
MYTLQQRRDERARDGELEEDPKDLFRPEGFAVGSYRSAARGSKFMIGFDSRVNKGHSRFAFDFDRRWIAVHLSLQTALPIPLAFSPLEAEFPFEDIVTRGVQAMRERMEDGKWRVTLTITTRRPPKFYVKVKAQRRRATERDFVFSVGPFESEERGVQAAAKRCERRSEGGPGGEADCRFDQGRDVEEMRTAGCIIREGHAGPLKAVEDDLTIKINSWYTYRFQFILETPQALYLTNLLQRLGAAGREDGLDLLAHDTSRKKIQVVAPEAILPTGRPQAILEAIPQFPIRYLVEGLVTHGIVIPSELGILIAALTRHCPAVDLKGRVLRALYNEERVKNMDRLVQKRSRQLRKEKLGSNHHQVWVHRCQVTPTRVLLFPPEQETSNDVIRKHGLHVDRFLRVQFTDEDDRIQINPTVKEMDDANPAVGTIARVRRALASGLKVAGRHYVFLASGSSQAREHSCWFICEDHTITAAQVRQTMGMEGIREKIVAKYAARMGLPFSTTRAVTLEVNIRKDLPDVVTQDRARLVFTDGVGQCGIKVARQAAREFGITEGVDAYPSAIQIRNGGTKGVLGVWPELMHSHDVRFRKSMIKFETNRKEMAVSLNVVRISTFSRAFLNRQFIILMNHLGIPTSTFVTMFEAAMRKSRGLPERYRDGRQTDDDDRASSGLSTFPIKKLALAGFSGDPCFGDVTKVLETRLLTDLKWKNRMEVEQGVYLMGIADEMNVLEEGTVFCQWRNPADPGEGPTLVEGDCVIMRAPALHPGDLRRVKAVYHDKLKHLVNVIVFAVKGQRPLPNMLAGGDLDGDDYTLIWDKTLIPKYDVEAMDYTPPEPIRVAEVTMDNVKANDILGQVSNAHLAQADRDAPDSRACIELAQEASIAVDFPKTGVPAKLTQNLRPRSWPTFFGKDRLNNNTSNYRSKKVLGVLFELVHPEPEFRPTDIRTLPNPVDPRLAAYKLPASLLDEAFRLKQDYDVHVMGLMNRYRITEAEVVAGIILKNQKRRRGKDADIKEPVTENYKNLAQGVLDHAQIYLSTKAYKNGLKPLQIFALAAYQVTFIAAIRKEVEDRLEKKDGLNAELQEQEEEIEITPMPMISFPWVFSESLLDLPNVRRVD